MPTDHALLQRIDDYLNAVPRAASDVEEIGPFTLYFRRDSTMPELSYARPTALLTDDAGAYIEPIRAAFARRGRVCRWEFLTDLVPQLPGLLVQCGFPEPIARPLMVVTRETFRPEQCVGIEIRRIARDETREVGRVLQTAFSVEDDVAESSEDLLAGMIERGSTACGAFVEGRVVAGGLHNPVGATTEVAGIGTLPAFRRRGIAGALTSSLVADAFERGCDCVFLSAADETVQRIYARVGFALVGTAMDTAEPNPPGPLP